MSSRPASGQATAPVDLRRLDEDEAATIRDQVSASGFGVFRGQHLEPAELERFVAMLGPLVFTPGEQPLDGYRFVFEVTNRGRVAPPRSVYHSDTSYVAETPRLHRPGGL